jgi:hypothetical protein
MSPLGLTYQRRVNRTCAVCDRRVTLVQGALLHRKVSATSTLYRAVAWCRLQPCGHVFAVRRGGLIH